VTHGVLVDATTRGVTTAARDIRTMTYDLVVHDASLRGADGRHHIGVADGEIAAVEDAPLEGAQVIDAGGGLVASGFVDPHVHLDQALIADGLPVNESGTLREAIAISQDRKAAYTVEDVAERATRAIELHVENGCTRIRTHVDVDTIGGLTPLEGVLEARDRCAGIAEVQIVAFPQEGIQRDPGTAGLLEAALEQGADAIGGMPDAERSSATVREHVEQCLELAEAYDVPVDMHVDESDDPSARSLEVLAERAIETGFERSITAGHTCALAAYDEAHAQRVIERCADAGLSFVTNPPTNFLLQGRHDQHPKRRGITRVDQLREAGLTVAAGQDCIQDGYYPYGRGSMLETALLTAHAAHLQTPAERRYAWETVTANAAAVLGLDHGVVEGRPATVNVFEPSASSPTAVFRSGAPPRVVLHEGQVVAENERSVAIHRP
jgi:cytosine deaminase